MCRLRCRTAALCDAARQGNTERLKSLLAKCADVHGKDSDGYVHLGARRKHLLGLCLDQKLVRPNRRRNEVEQLTSSGEKDSGEYGLVCSQAGLGRYRRIAGRRRCTSHHRTATQRA